MSQTKWPNISKISQNERHTIVLKKKSISQENFSINKKNQVRWGFKIYFFHYIALITFVKVEKFIKI